MALDCTKYRQKRHHNREALGRGCVSSTVGKDGENGGKFQTFCPEENANNCFV